MTEDEALARRRFAALSMVRLGGATCLTLGLLAVGGKIIVPQPVGFGLILLGLAVIAFFAAAFRAWRSGGASGILPRIGVSMIFNLAIVSSADYPLRTPILAALLMVAAIWATGREDTASGQAYG